MSKAIPMFRLCTAILLGVLVFGLHPSFAQPAASSDPQANLSADNDGFVEVDMSKLSKIDGKSLTVAAYATIFAILVIYILSLLRREKAIDRAAADLERRLKKSS